jgi:hypothetical protein
MEIQVYRPKQFADMIRDYQLLADNVEIAILKRGETIKISIPENTNVLQTRIDWCTSQEFKMSDLRGAQLTVKNSFSGNIVKLLFLFLYYITLGKTKYLKIERGI